MVPDLFDEAHYVNLDSRPDRRARFEARSTAAGISVQRFPAIYRPWSECALLKHHNILQTHDPSVYQRKANEISCAMSHQAIIRLAKHNGAKSVFVFEDDCVFLDEFAEQVRRVMNDITINDIPWDIIYFGGEPNNYVTPLTDNVAEIRSGGVYGCHAYVVNHTFFDTILHWDLKSAWGIIDLFLLHVPETQRHYLLSRTQVALQDNDSMSDLRGHVLTSVQEQHTAAWHKFVETPYHAI
jgi:hypothetical protein